MGKKTTKKSSNNKNGTDEDVYQSILKFNSAEEARKFIRANPLDLVNTETQEDQHLVTFFLDQREIAELKKGGHSVEVGENVSATGRERQKEVAQGDRFKGGRIAPKSLGVANKGAR